MGASLAAALPPGLGGRRPSADYRSQLPAALKAKCAGEPGGDRRPGGWPSATTRSWAAATTRPPEFDPATGASMFGIGGIVPPQPALLAQSGS